MTSRSLFGAVAAASVCAAMGIGPSANAQTVSVPPDVGGVLSLNRAREITPFRYTQSEFFLSGTATSYTAEGPLGADGRWNAMPAETAPYTTRIIVRRPQNGADFTGRVVFEWLNVSAGADVEPDWIYGAPELLRSGDIWVGVSAQRAGAASLQTLNPDRYAAISHPGDAFSYDIFTQAVRAVRRPKGQVRPLADATGRISTTLATGHSQSASRLITYHNAIEPLENAFDAYLIHGIGRAAPLSQTRLAITSQTPSAVPDTSPIQAPTDFILRTDLSDKVILLNAETDVLLLGGAFTFHNQPDNETLRVWEVPGTAHIDACFGAAALPCGAPPVNTGSQTYAVRTAFRKLRGWRKFGIEPSIAPRMELRFGPAGDTVEAVRDPRTNIAKGGIRYPDTAAPTATLTGIRPEPATGGFSFCFLSGASDKWNGDSDSFDGNAELDISPFPEPDLAERYGSLPAYQYTAYLYAVKALRDGFLLFDDFVEILEPARNEDF